MAFDVSRKEFVLLEHSRNQFPIDTILFLLKLNPLTDFGLLLIRFCFFGHWLIPLFSCLRNCRSRVIRGVRFPPARE